MNKYILFLGVSDVQESSLKTVKNLGLGIIGVDGNANAHGKSMCDHFFNINCLNIQEIYNHVKPYNIRAIWANNDVLIPTRTMLSRLLHIRDMDTEAAIRMMNKVDFKLDYVDSMPNKINTGKWIVKPITGGGSQGISIVSTWDNIEVEGHIVEPFIEGKEYGVNMFVHPNSKYPNSDYTKLGGVYRYFNHIEHHVPLGTITSHIDNKIYDVIWDNITSIMNNEDFYKSFQIKADILQAGGNTYIIEMSPRFHGEIDTELVYGSDRLSLVYFNWVMGGSMSEVDFIDTHRGYFSMFNLNTPHGNSIDGIKLTKYVPHIRKFTKGLPQSTADITGYVLFESDSHIDDERFLKLSKELNND